MKPELMLKNRVFEACWRIANTTVLLVAILGMTGAIAGEMPRAGKRPGAPGAEDEEKKPETLHELRMFQAFTYVPGGRDPMTIRLRTEAEAGADVTGSRDTTGVTGQRITPEDKREMLRECIIKVETSMLDHDYKSALKTCSDMRNQIDQNWGDSNVVSPDAEVNRLYRRLLAYERTAKRLQQTIEIQQEFLGLNLEVKGVRWTPTGASALVNDTIYEPGGVIKDKGIASPVQIERIEEQAVVFIYKGQRFRKVVGTLNGDATNER